VLALEILYLFSVVLLAAYGLNSLLLIWLFRQHKGESSKERIGDPVDAGNGLPCPHVTVQLPVYNERHVVERLIEAAVRMDWPAERLQIQVLDDSTDETRQIIAAALERYRAQGLTIEIEHVRRPDRSGFKAGALQHGLASARGEFVAIFDADFVPPPDFLKRTIPGFDDPVVGCVQTRWGHVNPDTSQLTKAQSLGIDGHFVVEQAARHAVRAYLNFNGTAGVWRRACMDDAGGWQGDTLTEDLDLSYRAQLRGWRIAYQPEVVVPAELPVQIDALKRQQFRWAKGSIQTARKLLGRLWRAPEPVWLKLMGTMHLTNYSVHPLMLVNLLLILPMTLSGSPVLVLTPFLTLSAIGPPLLYWTAMRNRHLSTPTRLGRLAVLVALGTGLAVNNTQAVVEAVLGIDSDFKRTPKFAVTGKSTTWQTSAYALPRNPAAWLELLLALYAFTLLVWTISQGVWWLVPWLIMYTGGYAYVSGLAFLQAWETKTARSAGGSLVKSTT
jgi:cellulose synthase/poly-beta-1,6-N-acetylglucosamine synthase-like glycosyltransferase